jgi:nudix-type nucleoside diphosphatase (YffH/AdpP family)
MSVEITQVETRYEGRSRFLVVSVRFSDGRVSRREIEDHGGAVGVLPYDPVRRTAILVRQFRAPVFLASRRQELHEAVAGVIEPGEAPADCARRETLEEAGLQLATVEQVANAWTMPGISTERMALFLAPYRPQDRVAAGGGVDHDEDIRVVELALEEVAAMADTGRLDDMKALALVQTLRLRRPDLFA